MILSKHNLIKIFLFIIFILHVNYTYGQVDVTVPDLKVMPDSEVLVSIIVSELSPYEIIAYQFHVKYDPSVLSALGVSSENTLSAQWGSVVVNCDTPGVIIIGAFGTKGLSGMDGDTLLNLKFLTIAAEGDKSLIELENFRFNDNNPVANIKHGEILISNSISGVSLRKYAKLPRNLNLLKNYPDPFYHNTSIWLHLEKSGEIQLSIINVLGQVVRQYRRQVMSSGSILFDWNATNINGEIVNSGVYFCIARQGNRIIGVDKMIFVQ